MIQNIEISKLHNHPKNPRRDLGDLTELAESIKVNGIFQNLTVVPWFSIITGVGADDPKAQEEMGYYVVIGNRRLGAAKLAGLTELPCVLSDMDEKTQQETMLMENMQRNDLTVWEQAQGFQMLLELGDSITDISARTGFSETTVRRRLNITKLNNKKVKEAVDRGATLLDFIELERIQDVALRNKVLEKIGTSNFKWELQQAIENEKCNANKSLIEASLKEFATEIDNINGFEYITTYYPSQGNQVKKPEDADTVEYFYTSPGNKSYVNYYTLYKKGQPRVVDTATEEKRKKTEELKVALKEVTKRAYQLRLKFAKDISNTKCKKNIGSIIKQSIKTIFDYPNVDIDDLAELLDITQPEDGNDDEEDAFETSIYDRISAQPERHLFLVTYLANDSETESYYNWNAQKVENEVLDEIYALLEELGYEMSDEEKALMNGTHELFENSEAEK
ncbi:MAG: parB-like partition protein [Eubacterium sp.]|jgi:ParB family chromosome partitioning protein|nr:parB-like partition protein [Eubacterium sp.]